MRLLRAFALLILSFSAAAQTLPAEQWDISALQAKLRRVSARGIGVPGVAIAIARNGTILWEEGFGWADQEKHIRVTKDTPFYVASVTKAITATAIMELKEKGTLSIDAPVNDYVGSTKLHSPLWNASDATVRRVLSHTGGLTTFARWCAPEQRGCGIDEEIRHYGILVWPPGRVFDYSNLGYGILGQVVARTSGERFDSYLKRAIFDPLNMRHCVFEVSGAMKKTAAAQYDEKTHQRSLAKVSGTPGASGLHCSAHDLLLFGMFQLKDRLTERRLLSGADIDEMHEAQPNTHGQYGLGWWVTEQNGHEVLSAQGGTSDAYALLTIVPSQDMAVVVLANSYSAAVSQLGNDLLSTMTPRDNPASQPARSQPAIPAQLTHSLLGKWSGHISTDSGPVAVSLEINSAGSVRGQIGTDSPISVSNVSLKPDHFFGQLAANTRLADAPSAPYTIDLDLALQGADLIGAATSHPSRGGDVDELPHWVELSRRER